MQMHKYSAQKVEKMLRQIRAFLFYPDSSGNWACKVFREFEPLIVSAMAINANDKLPVAIHVGFDQPDITGIEELLAGQNAYVFLSTGAVGTLPSSSLRVRSLPVGTLNGTSFYLALDGFGYEIVEEKPVEIPETNDSKTFAATIQTKGWVFLVKQKPELFKKLLEKEIFDDDSYLENEDKLDVETRIQVGLLRFQLLEDQTPNAGHIFDQLKSTPPWLLQTPVTNLDLTVRSLNVCDANDIKFVADFIKLGNAGLMRLPNLGSRSVHQMAEQIVNALKSGNVLKDLHTLSEFKRSILEAELTPVAPAETEVTEGKFIEYTFDNISEGFLGIALTLNSDDRVIWVNRIGLQCPSMTLQQVADLVGLTRERVRQILVKIYKKIGKHRFWIDLNQRLNAHLEGRSSPICLDDISVNDPWFQGVEELASALSDVSERLEILSFHTVTIQNKVVISTIDQSEWLKAIEDAKSLLKIIASRGLDEVNVKSQIADIFTGRGKEMIGPLIEEVSQFMVWVTKPDCQKILCGYCTSLNTLILGILEGSDKPLHVEEILVLVQQQKGYEDTNFRYTHNAASDVGILFNRGTFGLLKHCPLTADQMQSVRAEVEDMVFGGATTKQWHCSEFYDELVLRGFSFEGKLTKYVINLALKESTYLVYLKRMVWGLRGQWTESAESRLDVTDAIVSLLEETGRPMNTVEIRQKLESVRGLNVHFQIWAFSPLVRLGPGFGGWRVVT